MLRPIAISSLIVSICLLFVDVVSMAPPEAVWGDWWTVLRLSQEHARIAIVPDNVTEGIADLSIPELFREVQAQEHGTVEIARGLVLFRSGRADDAVGHGSFRLMPLVWHRSGGNGAVGGHPLNWHGEAADQFVILTHDDNQWI